MPGNPDEPPGKAARGGQRRDLAEIRGVADAVGGERRARLPGPCARCFAWSGWLGEEGELAA